MKTTNDRGKSRTVLPPPVLYTYYSFDEHTPAIFERNEIYFQSADRLNDPFDMKIFYDGKGTYAEKLAWLERNPNSGCAEDEPEKSHAWALRLTRRPSFESSILRDYETHDGRERREMRVFCMAAECDNILMWTHYADKHQGFCLGWATANPFFSRARRIDYSRRAPNVRIFDSPDLRIGAEFLGLFTKARDWAYEREWRIVERKPPDVSGAETYPPNALSEVILGCRISTRRKKRIIKWCSQRKTPPVLYGARPKMKEFGLDIVPIAY